MKKLKNTLKFSSINEKYRLYVFIAIMLFPLIVPIAGTLTSYYYSNMYAVIAGLILLMLMAGLLMINAALCLDTLIKERLKSNFDENKIKKSHFKYRTMRHNLPKIPFSEDTSTIVQGISLRNLNNNYVSLMKIFPVIFITLTINAIICIYVLHGLVGTSNEYHILLSIAIFILNGIISGFYASFCMKAYVFGIEDVLPPIEDACYVSNLSAIIHYGEHTPILSTFINKEIQ